MLKNLKVSEETHKIIVDYCDKNGLLMYKFVDKILLDYINKIEEKKNVKIAN